MHRARALLADIDSTAEPTPAVRARRPARCQSIMDGLGERDCRMLDEPACPNRVSDCPAPGRVVG